MLRTYVLTRHLKLLSRSISIRLKSNLNSKFEHLRRKRMAMEMMPPSRDDPIIMKLDSPEFRAIFTPELEKLAEIFKRYDYEMRIAGGAVRDILMGLVPKDLDFATTATPDEMKKMLTTENIRMINDRGERHGTITARINDKENFEVTTLRIDIATDGRHADVQFTKDWKLDANRRDLTINSMFLDLDGNVYDYFYGYEDLQKKRIVFVGDAATRIKEDFLRILRYFRFYGRIAEFPDRHEDDTINAIKDNVNGLERISGERLWSELSKIIVGRYGGELVVKMLDCGVGPYIGLPKNPDIDNFTRTYVRSRENSIVLRPVTLLTSLLRHDYEIMDMQKRLRLSVVNRDLAIFLVQNREEKLSEKPLRPYQRIVIEKSKFKEIREFVRELLKLKGATSLLEEFDNWKTPKFPVNGHDLKTLVPNAKLIGQVNTSLKKQWFDDDFKMSRDDLLKKVPEILHDIEENKK